MTFYDALVKIFSRAVKLFFRIHVYDLERESTADTDRGMLVCCNHISFADVVVLAACLKKHRIRFLAKAEIFKVPVLKQFATAMGAFPVERGKADVGAIKKTLSLLEAGETIGFFPQGTRYPDVNPATTSVRNGIGMIAYRSDATILPVYLQTKNNRIRPFRRVNLFIGEPFRYRDLNCAAEDPPNYPAASREVFDRILGLNRTVE